MQWKVKEKDQREDAAQTGKYHENKSLMGPLKVWGPRESIPCSLGGPGKRVMGREEGRRGKGYKEGGGGGAQDCFAVASERWEGEMGRCNVTET